MGDEGGKVENHVGGRVRPAERLAVERDDQRQLHLAPVPGGTEFVGRGRHRRECGRRLRLEEAEPLGEFSRDEIAQRHVVDEHDEPDRRRRVLARAARANVVDDDGDLRLEVDPEILARHDNGLAGGEKGRPSRPGTSRDRSRTRPASRRRGRAARVRHGSHRPSRRPTDRRAAAAKGPRARGSGTTAPRRSRGRAPAHGASAPRAPSCRAPPAASARRARRRRSGSGRATRPRASRRERRFSAWRAS